MKKQIMELLTQVNPKIIEVIDLLEEGLIDSFEIVNIVVELEEAFHIEIEPEFILPENFQTVESIVNLVEHIKE